MLEIFIQSRKSAMRRSYLFKKPDDEEDDYYTGELVHSKPIAENVLRKLGPEFGMARDFVRSTASSQKAQQVETTVPEAANLRALTHDEKNKLNARLLKAEMKGDKVPKFLS